MNKLSIWVILLSLLFYIFLHKTSTVAQQIEIFGHDQGGYYNYLPAFFIYKDLQFNYLKDSESARKGFITEGKHRDGRVVPFNRYSTGIAIMLSPFFGLAQLQAHWQGIPATGFSSPYQSWIVVGVFFYIFLAFLLLRHILIRYFDEKTTALSLLIIILGTNILHYVVYEPLMSHPYSFFLFSLTLFLSLRWLEQERLGTLLALGISVGFLANVRITNSIFVLVPILWGVSDFDSLRIRLKLFLKHWKSIILAIILAGMVFIPQILYWHESTGFWVLNAYGFGNEKFFFSDPMVLEILWGYKKGWLLYTPLMIFSLLGFVFLYFKLKEAFWGILLYTLLNLYIVSCWWCWWYGASFGMRALIESMVPLALSLAALVHWMLQSKWKQAIFIPIVVLGIGFNFFQTYQYSQGCIHSFGMTRKSYWAVFGQMPPLSPEVYKTYDKYLLGAYMNEMTWEARQQTKIYNERSEK